MNKYNWYQITGVTSLLLTGITTLWNRISISELYDDIENLPSEQDRNKQTIDLLTKELEMIRENDKKIQEQIIEINNIHDKMTCMIKKVDELDKKGNMNKKKISSVEKKLNESLNDHGLQMSTINQQLAAVESVYRDQLDILMEEIKQIKKSITNVDDKIEALERDKLLFAGINANSVQHVEELLNKVTNSFHTNPLPSKENNTET